MNTMMQLLVITARMRLYKANVFRYQVILIITRFYCAIKLNYLNTPRNALGISSKLDALSICNAQTKYAAMFVGIGLNCSSLTPKPHTEGRNDPLIFNMHIIF